MGSTSCAGSAWRGTAVTQTHINDGDGGGIYGRNVKMGAGIGPNCAYKMKSDRSLGLLSYTPYSRFQSLPAKPRFFG